MKRTLVLPIMLVLSAGTLSGCSVFRDFTHGAQADAGSTSIDATRTVANAPAIACPQPSAAKPGACAEPKGVPKAETDSYVSLGAPPQSQNDGSSSSGGMSISLVSRADMSGSDDQTGGEPVNSDIEEVDPPVLVGIMDPPEVPPTDAGDPD